MKLPLRDLTRLVPGWTKPAAELADLLTFSGTEVEGVSELGGTPVLECAVTSNRVDCLGWLGLARDVAAVAGLELVDAPCDAPFSALPTAEAVRIDVEDPVFCPRYVVLVIEGAKVGESPKWLKDAVESVGLRSVNNVVDVTNFVLFERNQPLHAFDLDRVRGARIVVRRALAGEKMKAINGREYALDPSMGLICDGEGPVAIAGVMGGAESEVSAGTKRILLEAACFEAPSIRRTSRALQLRSDSSHRFERGIDAEETLRSGLRAARLIMEVAGGTLRKEPLDVRVASAPAAAISFRPARVRAVGGVEVSAERCAEIFTRLGCRASKDGSDRLAVRAPTWRRDLSREIDLVEEVVRVEGLHRVPMGDGLRVRAVQPHPERRLADAVRDACVRLGFLECVTPTFVDEGVASEVAFASRGRGLKARNPVRAGEGAVRRSLMPSLLDVRTLNQDQGNSDLRLFEVANAAFDVEGGGVPDRVPLLGALLDGAGGTEADVRDGRGLVEALGEILGAEFSFEPFATPFLKADRAVAALIGGVRVGVAGVVAPRLVEAARLRVAPVYVELDLRPLAAAWRPVKVFAGLPRYPATTRDLAFVMDEARTYAELEACLRSVAPKELESVAFFDEFRGAKLGAGKKSLALSLVFRSDAGTLDGAQADAWIAAMIAAASRELGAALRA